MPYRIFTLVAGPIATNAYVIAPGDAAVAWIIDAPPEVLTPLLQLLEKHQLVPEAFFLTHSHWDHIGDAAAVREALGCPLYIHPADGANLRSPGADGVPAPQAYRGVEPDHAFHDQDALRLGGGQWQVLHTPGHTPGSCCLYCPDEAVLITGDTLFEGGHGRVDLRGGDPQQMRTSLQRLAALPGNTRFYPGHGPASQLARESWLRKYGAPA